MATKKYLDEAGVSYLWSKIDSRKQDKLVQGTNITLVNDATTHTTTISANVDLSGKQDKLSQDQMNTVNSGLTATDKSKLDGIEAGAQVNVQSDWAQTDNTAKDFIKNKPVIPQGSVLYDTTGQNTDGAMTQKATTDALDGKVDKVTGKQLSTEDYTTAEKTKLGGIEAGAQVNAIEIVKKNGTALTIDSSDKSVNVTVPTAVSELTNDSNYTTNTEVNNLINAAIASVFTYKGTKATTAALPTTGNKVGDVWHVTADASEYVWNGTDWELLGTVIDLSNYVQNSDLVAITTAEIDAIFV